MLLDNRNAAAERATFLLQKQSCGCKIDVPALKVMVLLRKNDVAAQFKTPLDDCKIG
jgi:hypothetical protein